MLVNIHGLMNDSLKAYQDYLQNGKTYRYAKELRRVNSLMINLLEEGEHLLKDDLLNAAAHLREHYTAWRNKWDQHQELLSPGPDDIFAFENAHTFPRHAASLFEEQYKALVG